MELPNTLLHHCYIKVLIRVKDGSLTDPDEIREELRKAYEKLRDWIDKYEEDHKCLLHEQCARSRKTNLDQCIQAEFLATALKEGKGSFCNMITAFLDDYIAGPDDESKASTSPISE